MAARRSHDEQTEADGRRRIAPNPRAVRRVRPEDSGGAEGGGGREVAHPCKGANEKEAGIFQVMRVNFHMSEDSFRRVIGSGGWTVQDLPPSVAGDVRPFLDNEDTLAVFASGMMPSRGDMPCGGIDWVRIESRPAPGETPLNVYHFEIGPPSDHGYPVYGPFTDDTAGPRSIAPHWSDLSDLEVY